VNLLYCHVLLKIRSIYFFAARPHVQYVQLALQLRPYPFAPAQRLPHVQQAGSNSSQTQLAALYLDINCAVESMENGAGTAYILQTLKAKWPQCNYLTSNSSGTITPQQIYDQSVPLVTTKCSNITGCIGGLLGYVDSVTCNLSVLLQTRVHRWEKYYAPLRASKEY
jgi:hypothetical protein